MVFNSLTFAVFFAAVLAVHALPLPWTWRKLNLLLASYLFYAAWNPPFVLLLILAAVVDYYLAHWMGRTDRPGVRRGLLVFSISLNLGLLSYFKYGQFLLDNCVAALAAVGVHYQPPRADILLPLGISFYTFETISYLIDVYRRRLAPWRSFIDYALFLTFFPHLVAGPIVRAGDFLPQCANPRRATPAQFGWGLCLLALGLCEKVVVADGLLAPAVDVVYNAPDRATFADAWVGTLAFSGQIFFDFSGYSLCGIGAALCLGFVLNDNFRFPYAAVGFSDFWQRWHISLSSWLRDYLYVPLGGNRRGPRRTLINLVLTMLLGGLWHGAAWRFVAWGGLHGLYLVGQRGVESLARRWRLAEARGLAVPGALVTYLLVCVAWVFFRAETFGAAGDLLRAMARPSATFDLLPRSQAALAVAVIAFMLIGQWHLRRRSLEEWVAAVPWWTRSAALALLIVALVLAPGDTRAFIYFQF